MPKRSKNPRLKRWAEPGAFCIGCGLWVPSANHAQHHCPGRGLDRKARAQVKRIVARAIADALAAIVARMGR
jgi:hypothetical protein